MRVHAAEWVHRDETSSLAIDDAVEDGALLQQVRDALAHLYDPPYLHSHPLMHLVQQVGNGTTLAATKQLQRCLTDAIESLHPTTSPITQAEAPRARTKSRTQARALRRYQVMALRYLEALPAQQVQQQVAISRTEYYRIHQEGLEAVVSLLRERWSSRARAYAAEPASDFTTGSASFNRTGCARPRQEPNASRQLPLPLTSFVGRERELSAIRALLTPATGPTHFSPRLVTLTGPGGIGKTQFAIQAAAGLLDTFADGICFVSLAPVSDPTQVYSAVATALGLHDNSARSLREALNDHLRSKHLLLLLDNFEQVLEAGADIANLLSTCPRLTVLVTSRTALRVAGEHLFPVPPLSVPTAARTYSPEALSQCEAVTLFVQRACAVKPDFRITHENATAVAEICTRLDGLPLAIELAAARMNLLPPEALLARLDSRLRILTRGARNAPARQQTLRDTIAWSYDLLTPKEQMLFMRLGVFVGGWTLDAAEAVCADGTGRDWDAHATTGDRGAIDGLPLLAFHHEDTLEGLQSLVDKSLLLAEQVHRTEPRFRMLETIREYAIERLQEARALDGFRRRHAMHFLTMAEAGERGLHSPDEVAWIARLERDHDNFRAALHWAMDHDEAAIGLRLAYDLFWFWQIRGYQREGRSWVTQLLSLPSAAARTVPRGLALYAAARFAVDHGDIETGQTLAEEALAIGREVNDPVIMGQALCLVPAADFGTRRALLEESAMLLRSVGHHWTHLPIFALGEALLTQGDRESARRLIEEALAFRNRFGSRHMQAIMLRGLSALACSEGDLVKAQALAEESLPIFYAMGDRTHLSGALLNLGWIALHQGNAQAARHLLTEALASAYPTGNHRHISRAIQGMAAAAATQGHAARALRLEAAVTAYRSTKRWQPPAMDEAHITNALHVARQALSADQQEDAWAAGLSMNLEQVINYALDLRPERPEGLISACAS